MSARPSWHKGILYNNPVRSDVVIKCGSHEYHAHKVILMAASGLFYTAFNSNFSVAEASTYEIDGYEPEIVESMIRYIYKSPPSDKPFERPYYKPSNWPSDCTLDWTLQCFAIANEYQVPSLCRAVTECITESCAKHVEKLKSCNKHDKTFSFILDHISALYRDNVIADRSLIESVADMLTKSFCHALIRPEVMELLYVRRTTRPDKPPSDPVSTMFRPVTMSDWSKKDLGEARKSRNVIHAKPWLFGQP
ncbi:hypothetical protein KCU67_g3794, partial [Aureobasidium melanogenum]